MTDEELMQKIKDADFSKLVEVLGAYEKGLADAWECARKIGRFNQLMLEDAGFVIKEEYENGIRLDWNPSFYVINKYSASEAIKKIKEYEERHK